MLSPTAAGSRLRQSPTSIPRHVGGQGMGPLQQSRPPRLPLDGLLDGLQEDASRLDIRYVPDYGRLREIAQALRDRGARLVLTSGSFDILHEGHSMYLEASRQFGDFLVVGVDSDEKIRARKGRGRPAVPEAERLRMVAHQRGVGLVALKGINQPRWELIRAVQPDVLVVTEDIYDEAEIRELESELCVKVVVLGRMATISTSARLRLLQLRQADALADRVAELVPDLIRRVTQEMAP